MKKVTRMMTSIGVSALSIASVMSSTGSMAQADTVQHITVWDIYGPGNGFSSLVKQFNKTHPKIQVTENYIPSQTGMYQKVQVISSSNAPKPDLLVYDMTYAPVTRELLNLVDLNTFIKADPSFNVKDYYPEFVNFGNHNGAQYSIHAYANDILLYYNKKLFKQAGLDPNKPPQTWDQLIQDSKKLTNPSKGQYGLEMDAMGSNPYFEFLSWEFQTFLEEAGGQVFNKDYTKPEFDSPQGVKALQWLVDLVRKYKVISLSPPANVFQTGKTAMYVTGSWTMKDYSDSLGKDLGVALLPKDVRYGTNIGGEEWEMVQSNPQEEKAAWTFLKWMTSQQAQFTIAQSGDLPTRKSVVQSAQYQLFLKQNPGYKVAIEALNYGYFRAPITQYPQISQTISKYCEEALYGQLTAKQALDQASQAVTQILATQK